MQLYIRNSALARRYNLARIGRILFIIALITITGNSTLAAQTSGDQNDDPAASEPSSAASFTPKINLFLPVAAVATRPPADATTLDQHAQDDYALAELARQRNEPPFQIPEAQAAATGPLNQVGQWGAAVSWPFAFASAASLPDGRIIAWGANNQRSFTGGTFTYSSIWDPATGQFLSRNRNGHPMFCAIPTTMEDGRIFVNGGDADSALTSIFDYRTNQWSSSDTMNTGRWYPGSVMLPGDKVFTMIGRPGGPYPELWTEENGWSLLTGANLNNGVLNYSGYQSTWLPYLHLMPTGKIFHAGPTPQMNIIDPTGNGSITSAGLTNSWYPKYSPGVMYDEGKLLIAGGAANDTSTAPGTNQAMILDFSGSTPTKTNIAPMNYARKFNNGIVLPTGEVLVVGGNTSGIEFSDQGTILTPEIWNPTTRTWRDVADMSVPRNYHSVALLMTDGRVWSGGGGLCNCSADHMDHQVYSPPYLFNADGSLATRPTISTAPNTAQYGATLNVQASPNIQKFSLIKMSALTHNLNSDLRFLNVNFTTASSGNYALKMHSNPNVLTPGYWMLFAVNSQGVPSVAKVIQVVSSGAPQITPPGDQFNQVGDSIALQINASDPNGDALTFGVSGLPTGLTMNSSGLVNGEPSNTGVYNVTVTVSDGQGGSVSAQFTWTISLHGGGSGQILREWWTGISGTGITNLTGNANYPNAPSGSDMLASFEAPTDWADNYGTRVRGYLHAPVTGQYRFWIASDDYGQLWLSTDSNPANAVQIANVPGWSSPRQWNKYSQQQSALITLQGGQKYYIEALQKEGGGLDNLAVAWQMPGGAQEVIAGEYLSPMGTANKYRYVRLVAESEVNGNPWTSAAEFNVLDGNGATISRAGWTITADSQETTGEDGRAVNAIDGSTSTIWHTQWQAANPTPPHQITVDMGTFQTVGGFRYLPRQDSTYNGAIAAYKFYVSVDGTNWGQPVAQGTFATSKTEKTVTFDLTNSNEPPVLTNPGDQNSAVGASL
ncbi:MAG: DUF1929 domain-containing protein, partial [Caldilineaceae bacterium]|nr:DUF1929 domain-containing protein [Caldilineaceae bacterium]